MNVLHKLDGVTKMETIFIREVKMDSSLSLNIASQVGIQLPQN